MSRTSSVYSGLSGSEWTLFDEYSYSEENEALTNNAWKWSKNQVQLWLEQQMYKWLNQDSLDELHALFTKHKVDGQKLLNLSQQNKEDPIFKFCLCSMINGCFSMIKFVLLIYSEMQKKVEDQFLQKLMKFSCMRFLYIHCIVYILLHDIHREITKLNLRAIEKKEEETTINVYLEMKKRIAIFTEKWDKILWIEQYVETNNEEPSAVIIEKEQNLSRSESEVYLQHYRDIEVQKENDLYYLCLQFNVHDDAVIWWFEIINSLAKYPSKSLWLIFAKVAEITPAPVSIVLLEEYKYSLTRFASDELDKVCQSIVVGSHYPICTALRIAKWFHDRAKYDVAQNEKFTQIADSYIGAANSYIQFLELIPYPFCYFFCFAISNLIPIKPFQRI